MKSRGFFVDLTWIRAQFCFLSRFPLHFTESCIIDSTILQEVNNVGNNDASPNGGSTNAGD